MKKIYSLDLPSLLSQRFLPVKSVSIRTLSLLGTEIVARDPFIRFQLDELNALYSLSRIATIASTTFSMYCITAKPVCDLSIRIVGLISLDPLQQGEIC